MGGVRVTMTFGVQDVAAVGFAISPLQHLILGVHSCADFPALRARWWRSVRRNLPAAATPLIDLIKADAWYLPDFLTPPVQLAGPSNTNSLAEELDAVRAVSPAQLRAEMQHYNDIRRPVPHYVRALADGGDREVRRLVDAAHAFYRACLADDWPDMQRRLRADVERRRAVLGSTGLAAMLSGVEPSWQDPSVLTLTFPSKAAGVSDGRVFAGGGKGFLLAPNLFLVPKVTVTLSPYQRMTFIYGVVAGPARSAMPRDTLAAILGRGRAAALRHIAAGCTTAELANRMHVSAPTASVHAATLRDASLISTLRDGRRVIHTLTALGAEMLEANPAPEQPV